MPELTSKLDGVDRKKKVLSYAVDLVNGTCTVQTEVVLDWTAGADAKCLSTTLETVTIALSDFPEMDAALEIVYKKIGAADEVYVATMVAVVEEVK